MIILDCEVFSSYWLLAMLDTDNGKLSHAELYEDKPTINNKDLLRIIHSELQPLGLSRTETLMCFKDGFRKKLPIAFASQLADQ